MIRNCPRNHSARITPRTTSFILFKPLIAIASLAIMFELLPIDFQNWLAPSLVSYDDVYWATAESEGWTPDIQDAGEGCCVDDPGGHYLPDPLGTSL